MTPSNKTHTQKGLFAYLQEHLEKRLEKAERYPNLRHTIKDELETLKKTPRSKQDSFQFKFFAVIALMFFFELFFFLIPAAIIVLVFWMRKKENKIRNIAYTAPINDSTEDRLDTLLHSSPTHSNTKHDQDFEIFPSSENPWIK